jgi:hypothetical protein
MSKHRAMDVETLHQAESPIKSPSILNESKERSLTTGDTAVYTTEEQDEVVDITKINPRAVDSMLANQLQNLSFQDREAVNEVSRRESSFFVFAKGIE